MLRPLRVTPAPATRTQTPPTAPARQTPTAPATRTQTPTVPATRLRFRRQGLRHHRFRRRGLRRYRFRCEQLPHRNTQRFGDCPNVLEGRISHASLYAGEVSHMDARTVRNFFLRERTQPSEIPDVLSEGCFVSVQLDIDVKPMQTIRP